MELLRSLSPLGLALLVTELVLLMLLGRTTWEGTDVNRLLATPPRRQTVPSAALEPPTRLRSFESIQESSLFYASRHFLVPPASDLAALPKPDYRLTGTFIVPNRPAVAILSAPSGASRKVAAGDLLDGWTVASVEAKGVELRHGSETYELANAPLKPGGGLQAVSSTAAPENSASTSGVRQLGSGGISRVHLAAASHQPRLAPRLYHAPPK